jgi:hypothetical protein
MVKRLPRSNEERKASEINYTRRLLLNSLRDSFNNKKFLEENGIIARTQEEIATIKEIQITEIDRYTSLDLMSAIEARFKIDFFYRCENKLKDDLSRDFRNKYKSTEKGMAIRLYEDILTLWIKYNPNNKNLFLEINSIFLYRHWLAHGRFWKLKINSSKYTFDYIYTIYLSLDDIFKDTELRALKYENN